MTTFFTSHATRNAIDAEPDHRPERDVAERVLIEPLGQRDREHVDDATETLVRVLVHLDTDIGGDPDDVCALAMLLGWPDVEIVGHHDDTRGGGAARGLRARGAAACGASRTSPSPRARSTR